MSWVQPRIYLNLNAGLCISGFCGSQRDANILVSKVQQPPADLGSNEEDHWDPCPEDEEFFKSRQDADVMEEAISKFMDAMEAQERGGFKDLHWFLGLLPVPTAKESQGMTHTEALEGGFLPVMDEEEQKQFTPSELLLYQHALEYMCIQTNVHYILECS